MRITAVSYFSLYDITLDIGQLDLQLESNDQPTKFLSKVHLICQGGKATFPLIFHNVLKNVLY